jgi:ubiquinone/menaquinone biosynthesis C-methylase UbiE
MPAQVDYDSIASTYNRRYTGQTPEGTFLALQDLVRVLGAEQVLEVGCGTGHWLIRLSEQARRVVGLDYSAGMLDQALQADPGLPLVRGSAEALPFPGNAFDFVFCVNAIHHFQRQRDFIEQAYQILRPGGALAVLGMDPRGNREDWYVYEYFEGTYETDLARFPSWGQVSDWMAEIGFERMELQLVALEGETKYGRAVLDDPFLAKHACSQLALLTDQAYAAGLARIRQVLGDAEAQGRPIVFQNTIRIHQLVGWRK